MRIVFSDGVAELSWCWLLNNNVFGMQGSVWWCIYYSKCIQYDAMNGAGCAVVYHVENSGDQKHYLESCALKWHMDELSPYKEHYKL